MCLHKLSAILCASVCLSLCVCMSFSVRLHVLLSASAFLSLCVCVSFYLSTIVSIFYICIIYCATKRNSCIIVFIRLAVVTCMVLVEYVPTSFGYVFHARTHFSNTRRVECRRPAAVSDTQRSLHARAFVPL